MKKPECAKVPLNKALNPQLLQWSSSVANSSASGYNGQLPGVNKGVECRWIVESSKRKSHHPQLNYGGQKFLK